LAFLLKPEEFPETLILEYRLVYLLQVQRELDYTFFKTGVLFFEITQPLQLKKGTLKYTKKIRHFRLKGVYLRIIIGKDKHKG
jgi:hypothetical protein